MRHRERNIGRGLLIGLVGGLVAAWTMNQFQSVWSKASKVVENDKGESSAESEDATQKAANKLTEAILHRELSAEEKKKAGPIVHYAFGAGAGAAYGVLTELFPKAALGFGMAFGATLFAMADEIAVPALGLSGSAAKAPLSAHLYGLASHVVYGATTESVRRIAQIAA